MNFRAIVHAIKARFGSKPTELRADAGRANGATASTPIPVKAPIPVEAPAVKKTTTNINANKPRRNSSTFVRLQALSASGTGSAQPTSGETNLKSVLDSLEQK